MIHFLWIITLNFECSYLLNVYFITVDIGILYQISQQLVVSHLTQKLQVYIFWAMHSSLSILTNLNLKYSHPKNIFWFSHMSPPPLEFLLWSTQKTPVAIDVCAYCTKLPTILTTSSPHPPHVWVLFLSTNSSRTHSQPLATPTCKASFMRQHP